MNTGNELATRDIRYSRTLGARLLRVPGLDPLDSVYIVLVVPAITVGLVHRDLVLVRIRPIPYLLVRRENAINPLLPLLTVAAIAETSGRIPAYTDIHSSSIGSSALVTLPFLLIRITAHSRAVQTRTSNQCPSPNRLHHVQ